MLPGDPIARSWVSGLHCHQLTEAVLGSEAVSVAARLQQLKTSHVASMTCSIHDSGFLLALTQPCWPSMGSGYHDDTEIPSHCCQDGWCQRQKMECVHEGVEERQLLYTTSSMALLPLCKTGCRFLRKFQVDQ